MSSSAPLRVWRFAAAGALLALGAPVGWAIVQHLIGETDARTAIYVYLTVGTVGAFATFGALVGRLADQLAAANRDLERLAAFDALTSLRNARTFHVELERACAESRRSGDPLSLIMIDLDHFKRVNDTFGHSAGDVVLASTGSILMEQGRSSDAAFRVGGEEFAVLCPKTSAEEAAQVAERFRKALETRVLQFSGNPLRVTASFGIASEDSLAGADTLFRKADAALYLAKDRGRNCVHLAAPTAIAS
jgi:diguanylate cyclase (GGDEF)-like protein